MPSPTLQYFEVVGHLFEDVQTNDTNAGGNLPEVHTFSGTVTFTPNIAEIESVALDAVIMLEPIVARFNSVDGILRALNDTAGISLVDNVNLGLDPGALTYRADYSNIVFDAQSNRHMASFRFAAPGDGSTVDVVTVTRLAL